jgi:hypothetical protein
MPYKDRLKTAERMPGKPTFIVLVPDRMSHRIHSVQVVSELGGPVMAPIVEPNRHDDHDSHLAAGM